MSAAGIAAPVRRPAQSKAALARTVKEQRRGYARAVLAALARSLQGRPTPQIRRIVKTSLQPLGVRLSESPRQVRRLSFYSCYATSSADA